MSVPRLRWHLHETPGAFVAAVVDYIAEAAAQAIGVQQRFVIVLSGGSTPRPVYHRAARLDTDWRCWHVYFTDERCLPAGDPARNDTMALGAWLGHVPIPPAQVHPIPAELGPESAAAAYRRVLATVGRFDLTLLGLGEDGHTASLFPGDSTGTAMDAADAIPVLAAPKPPASRVSLSARRLADAELVAVLAHGAGKRDAVRGLRDGADIPARAAIPSGGADVFVDSAATWMPEE